MNLRSLCFDLAFCAGLCFLLIPSNASAAPPETDALRAELTVMGNQIKELIDKKGGGSVGVGAFTASSSIKGSSGPELQLALTEILASLKLSVVTENYRFEIKGDYLSFTHPENKLLGIKVVGRLIDAGDGGTLGEFSRFLFGEETVPRMLGLSVKSSPNADAQQRSDDFKKAKEAPPAKAEGTVINGGPDSKYALEILVKEGDRYVPRAAKLVNGRPFVEIKKNEVYAVRLINRSPHEAAVRLTIDGINVFHFSETKPAPEYWVVAKGNSTQVVGWDKNNDKSSEFKSVELHETAAAKLNLKPDQSFGLISASFSACWEKDADKPEDEAQARGTGFGNEIVDKKEQVSRQIGHCREVITVRYER